MHVSKAAAAGYGLFVHLYVYRAGTPNKKVINLSSDLMCLVNQNYFTILF